MGRRGPKPTPKAVLAKRGSWRAKITKKKKKTRPKKPNLSIVKVTGDNSNRPARPQWITGEAQKEWIRVIKDLEEMGVLDKIDRTMLALYCKAYAEWKEADELVTSLLIKTSNNNIVQHPALSIRSAAWERLKKICAEFGMSPAARTGMAITPKQPASKDKSRFFEKRSS